jgi:protease-4
MTNDQDRPAPQSEACSVRPPVAGLADSIEETPHSQDDVRPPQLGQTSLLLELMREMRGQRESFQEAQRLAASERKSEHRWRMLFQALVFGLPVLLGIVYFLFFLSSTGFRWGPFGDVVGVVRPPASE